MPEEAIHDGQHPRLIRRSLVLNMRTEVACGSNLIKTCIDVIQNCSFMDQNKTFENNVHELETIFIGFITAEVNASLTFADIALRTTDEVRGQVDTANARKGYETVLRFIAEARERYPDHCIAARSFEGIKKLKRMLGQLEKGL